MEKRNKLHDYSLALIFLAILDIFVFAGTVLAAYVSGTLQEALVLNNPENLTSVKVMLAAFVGLMGLMMLAEAWIGIKGLKVSRAPSADKGYITAAKIFLVLSLFVAVSTFVGFFETTAHVDSAITFVNAVLDVIVYAMFIKLANAVRADALLMK